MQLHFHVRFACSIQSCKCAHANYHTSSQSVTLSFLIGCFAYAQFPRFSNALAQSDASQVANYFRIYGTRVWHAFCCMLPDIPSLGATGLLLLSLDCYRLAPSLCDRDGRLVDDISRFVKSNRFTNDRSPLPYLLGRLSGRSRKAS